MPTRFTAPLATRATDQCLAQVGSRRVTVGEFLSQVQALAHQLPDYPYAINLCRNRYRLLLAFCAVMVRGQCNLLPASRQAEAQRDAARRYGPCFVLHDQADDAAHGLPAFLLSESLATREWPASPCPEIPLNQLAALSFTSGSTGAACAIEKTWRTLSDSTASNVRHMFQAPSTEHDLLATVPGQHMYGLETSVLAPLQANLCMHPGQPLFPDDVRAALERMTRPRVLVSTPLHLRVLVDSGVKFPPVDVILSATAPLEQGLAQAVERVFDAGLCEIYGCSEAGSIARRRTATSNQWEAFDNFRFRHESGETTVEADHLPAPVPLQDMLVFTDERRFTLRGRRSDQINVAGKRGSLAELNQLLLAIAGVEDGVVFQPDDAGAAGRLAALVVAPGLRPAEIAAALRAQVDPALVPRPVIMVDALPRSETGKMPRDALTALFDARVRSA